MLELYGWESVFYISGILAVLWAYCMWRFMLKGEGNCSNTWRKPCMSDWLTGLVGSCAPLDILFSFPCSWFQPTGTRRPCLIAAWLKVCRGELSSSCPRLCTEKQICIDLVTWRQCQQCLQHPCTLFPSTCFPVSPASVLVCPQVFVNVCLQGQSSCWSHWEAEAPNPNCPKGTGYVSWNSPLSGEVTIKKVIFLLEVTALLAV